MKRLFGSIRSIILKGFLALLPLALSYFVLRFLYLAVDQKVAPYIERWIGVQIPGLGFLLVLIVLFLLGLIASNWVGKGVFRLIEKISAHIPLVKTIYSLGMQLGRSFSGQEKQRLTRAVLVQHFGPGVWSIGFVMGTIREASSGEILLKLFIPTAPNPTAGFVTLVKESQVRHLDWTVAAAMNAVLSGGLAGPDEIP